MLVNLRGTWHLLRILSTKFWKIMNRSPHRPHRSAEGITSSKKKRSAHKALSKSASMGRTVSHLEVCPCPLLPDTEGFFLAMQESLLGLSFLLISSSLFGFLTVC